MGQKKSKEQNTNEESTKKKTKKKHYPHSVSTQPTTQLTTNGQNQKTHKDNEILHIASTPVSRVDNTMSSVMFNKPSTPPSRNSGIDNPSTPPSHTYSP